MGGALITLIPPDIYNRIIALAPPRAGRQMDRIAWKPTKDGNFQLGRPMRPYWSWIIFLITLFLS